MSGKIKYKFILFLLFTSVISELHAQYQSHKLDWIAPISYGLEGTEKEKILSFTTAQYDFEKNKNPFFFKAFENKSYEDVKLKNVETTFLTAEELELLNKDDISTDFELLVESGIVKKQEYTYLSLSPFRKNTGGAYEKLISFDLEMINGSKRKRRNQKSLSFTSESKLNSGEWYKIAVVNEGVFKLSYNFLSSLGIDLDEIDPRSLKMYGYGGGMLPAANDIPRPDDMQENAIIVVGQEDGSFDRDDYVLFFGEDQVVWRYDSTRAMFRHQVNLFDDSTFYFIRTDGAAGKRITTLPRQAVSPSVTVTEYDEYGHYEKEYTNLLKSGSLWVGELFDNTLNYGINFNWPNTNVAETGKLELSVLARSGVTSNFNLQVNGQTFTTRIGSVNLNRYDFRFVQPSRTFFDFTPNSGLLAFNVQYDKPQSVAKGWLNSLTVNVRRKLAISSGQLKFRDTRSVASIGTPTYGEFLIESPSDIRVWDLTDKFNIQEIALERLGADVSFLSDVNSLREYIAFEDIDSMGVFPKGKVGNQNLHGLPQADLLIISHPDFLSAANRLANFHREEGLSVNVVTPQQIYNEFSSGAQDLVALRTFAKMFYDRSTSDSDLPKYMIMFGDASYDYKDRITGNTNFVPAFQSSNSIDPVSSYVSDDYFGLLDDDEGVWGTGSNDRLDIAIGRLPVQTASEADGVVDKIARYYSKTALRDWRNKIVFVGDDEDGVLHMFQSNELSKIVADSGKAFNTEKIFLDAYQQQSTASGARYPQVTEDLNQAVENGALLINYTGHGGETGWTAERVLGIFDITNWENLNNMPVFITATCEFSRFDDPLRTSGGELVILNPNGGGAGLMTTTRLVFANPNYLLNRTFYDRIFDRKANGETKRLGDIFQEVKNFNAYSSNSRNFSLLGDPALKLALPNYEVKTSTINGQSITTVDTINALSTVTVTGTVNDLNGNRLTNFNGLVYPTVFDKIENRKTLNNDGGGVFEYETRERRIFKGKATVTEGNFSFSFVVPKDISYSFGKGKISYYAENNDEDANGYSEDFIIGGSNLSFVNDDQGPAMDLYMNDESFVYGGVTDNNPVLLVNLEDDQGINTVGSGIGHDLVAILDENTEKAFILNDFYEASVDDYSKGKVTFPFSDLTEGKHTLRVKAWDVANNSSEKTIEFNVVKSKEVKINNLVNYPNPFTTNTEFIFQHNQAGVPLDVKLEIFTVSGKLVKSFDEIVVNEGFISRDIRWDGRDDYGDKIGKGVYVYKLKVRSGNGSTSEKVEKLVIL